MAGRGRFNTSTGKGESGHQPPPGPAGRFAHVALFILAILPGGHRRRPFHREGAEVDERLRHLPPSMSERECRSEPSSPAKGSFCRPHTALSPACPLPQPPARLLAAPARCFPAWPGRSCPVPRLQRTCGLNRLAEWLAAWAECPRALSPRAGKPFSYLSGQTSLSSSHLGQLLHVD